MKELISRGFSSRFIKLFFEPFFGGVFLERNLATAASVFEFTFAMFSSGRMSSSRWYVLDSSANGQTTSCYLSTD